MLWFLLCVFQSVSASHLHLVLASLPNLPQINFGGQRSKVKIMTSIEITVNMRGIKSLSVLAQMLLMIRGSLFIFGVKGSLSNWVNMEKPSEHDRDKTIECT